MMMATRTRIEQEPNYTYVTARLLRDDLVATGLKFTGLPTDTHEGEALETFLKKGLSLSLFHQNCLTLIWRNWQRRFNQNAQTSLPT